MASIVETKHGKVEGTEKNGLHIFRGIPFAKPPVGKLRFRAPQEPESWSGVREAKKFSPAAPQTVNPLMGLSDFSEDCLYINVWTPGLDNKKRPVMFWIHGGGFTLGAASQTIYDGAPLTARGDVVFVSINYRLGALGFLFLNDLLGKNAEVDGNVGLQDQMAGLKWAVQNVEAFGGDPNNITLFGESAGGMSVGNLLAAPGVKGLFHKAICQSGATHISATRDDATKVAAVFLKDLQISPEDPGKLWEVSYEDVLKAQLASGSQPVTRGTGSKRLPQTLMNLIPVADGDVLPKDPYEAVLNGSAGDIPMLVGTCLDEWKLFSSMPGLGGGDMDEGAMAQIFEASIPSHGAEGAKVYKEAHTAAGRGTTPKDLFDAMETDRLFRIPSVRLAEAQDKQNAELYMYLLDWVSPMMGGILGCCHVVDLPFVFGLVDTPFGQMYTGGGDAAKALSQNMMDAWTGFARTGKPGHAGLDEWPTYDLKDRATMILGKKCRIEKDPMSKERVFWENVL